MRLSEFELDRTEMVSSNDSSTVRHLNGSRQSGTLDSNSDAGWESLERPIVYVLGELNMQNRLLADFLERSRVCQCRVLTPENASVLGNEEKPALLLADVKSTNYNDAINQCSSLLHSTDGPDVGLINVDSQADIEPYLYWKEVRGVFRSDTDHDLLIRGVEQMLAGHYWFPREALNHLLEQTRATLRYMNGSVETLTDREWKVLEALVEGATNETIAERLFISTHTVKSHLYNLYRKIEVSNRVEAAIWARRYLTYRRM